MSAIVGSVRTEVAALDQSRDARQRLPPLSQDIRRVPARDGHLPPDGGLRRFGLSGPELGAERLGHVRGHQRHGGDAGQAVVRVQVLMDAPARLDVARQEILPAVLLAQVDQDRGHLVQGELAIDDRGHLATRVEIQKLGLVEL